MMHWVAWHLPRGLVRACIVRGFAVASVKHAQTPAGEIICLDAWAAV